MYLREDPAELQKRAGEKYVFMHHIIGNTYSFTQSDWADDLTQMAAKGVDAVALNIGSAQWQRDQVASAYAAAASLGSGIKLFISFDLTEMSCDVNDLIGRVQQFSNHPSQFKVNGRPMVSSFSGDCLGHDGWAYLKGQTNGYLMPFIWGLEGQFQNWPELDSWYCWGCAWPQGNYDKTVSDDQFYINQLGARYATTVSGWMFGHYGYKNFYLRGDNWLINNRWEQIVSLRNQLTFVEMVTWNDFGESDYFGPLKGSQPDGTTWATGFPHTAWFEMSQYYITAFKTGSYPPILEDTIYYWSRPHPAHATASGDPIGKPTGWDWTEDSLWAAVFATAPATVYLQCGSSSQSFSVGAGVSKLKIPNAAGQITVRLIRNGATLINKTPSDFTFTLSPVRYNYNAYVGSAKGTSAPPQSTTTTTTPTITSSALPAQTTVVDGRTWERLGCYPDYSPRTLGNGFFETSSAQSIQRCLQNCGSRGYAYGGTEYGVECFCSNQITSGNSPVAASDCNMPCSGNSAENCGSGNRIAIYHTTSQPTTTAITSGPSPTSTGFQYFGCVAEGVTGTRRALTGASFSQSDMTPQVCQNLCGNYKYAGVEYGRECHCGDTLTNNGATGGVIAESNCDTPCAGDASRKCGGGWTLSVYSQQSNTNPSWTSSGCYTDSVDRMLRGFSVTQAGLTTDQCIATCSSKGFNMAAVEYGSECYCGSQLFTTGGAGTPASSSECNVPCSGNAGQTCGGPWRANLYRRPGTQLSRRHHQKRRTML